LRAAEGRPYKENEIVCRRGGTKGGRKKVWGGAGPPPYKDFTIAEVKLCLKN